ncbi:hypothetical protein DW322_18800 [Rhodococcus rhodnii]|uniref:Polysaccharide biosynthesis protein n=2 Tax=Rhodococcus rhodnii TaxID=38312 RepID=R7WJZ2_9NOCA|nr:hypothetical protein [Rhodococcus rhodnii]EOM75628.1 hypothetical protein Rrhod_3088 [Rhodococcus rhodnii LMG 5362]TXG91856.1 hypothetical protein DW322_18800 [Rhodococcus rhodnii]
MTLVNGDAPAAAVPPRRRLSPRRLDPRSLEFNSAALVVAGLVNGALGLVFWAVAARLYPDAEVGRAGAVVNTAVMLATLANLSLGPMYERFLPEAGVLGRRRVVQGQVLTTAAALVLGAVFVVIGPSDRLFETLRGQLLFPVVVAVLAAFALSDSLLVGLQAGRWAAAKNIWHAVAKLVAVLALGLATPMAGAPSMIVAWLVPAAAAVIVVQLVVTLLGRGLRDAPPRLPDRRALLSYFGGAYGITVVAAATPLVLPLVVVVSAGHEETAYFSVVWTLVAAIMLATGMVTAPFVSAAAASPERLGHLLRRFLRMYGIVALAAAAALALGGPIALWIVGPTYAEHGATLVRLMAVVALLAVPGTVFGVLCRVHRTLRWAVLVQIVATTGVITGSLIAVPRVGIDGIGYAFVAVEVAVALAVAVPLWRIVRRDLRQVSA